MEKVSPVSSVTSPKSRYLASVPPKPKPNSYFLQTKIMIWKQYLLFSRNIKSSLFQIGTPVFICLFLVSLQYFATYAFTNTVMVDPDVLSVSKIPKCYGNDCITVGIAYTNPSPSKLSTYVMNYISEHHDLELNKDIQVIATDYDSLIDYLSIYTNKTQTVILFCTGLFKLPDSFGVDYTFDCLQQPEGIKLNVYSLLINSTITPLMFFSGFNAPRPVDYASLAVKAAVDSAILQFYSNSTRKQTFNVDVQHFPAPTNRFIQGYDIVTDVGVFYFFIPPMVTFVVILIEIVREKEYRLRHGLSMMGLTPGPYWTSWIITGFVFSFIVTNSLIITSLACDFDIFLYTPYPIILFLFMSFSMAMLNLAYLLSTIIKTTKAAYTSSYAFILIGLVLQFLLSDVNLIYLLYSQELPEWARVARILLSLYPPFNFSKAFGDISLVSGAHYSSDESRWLRGENYSWTRFTEQINTTIAGNKVIVPSTFESVLIIIANGVLIGIIAWYLDHTLSSNRGTADPLYFPLTPSYWGCKRSNKLKAVDFRNQLEPVEINYNSLKDEDLNNPHPSIIDEYDFKDGVSIHNIGKIFKQRGCCKFSQIHAVNDLSMEIGNKELLAILGHNGAGKSTLINILTGLTQASYGSGSVCGFDINTQMAEIRKILGVCPQHDILWSELTPFEHLVIFGRIKNIPYEEVVKEAEEKLIQVRLKDVRNKQVGTFSGGMKRRLSVAIAGVGNPRIIILDEPTTGMDPINRRNAWKLIQKMKEGRVVLLTTHSMEEADVLSDRVCVIVDGELKCLGTALSLKNNYGDGYRISIITEEPEVLQNILLEEFQGLKVIDLSAGSLVVSLPIDRGEEIQRFFRAIEGIEDSRFGELIKDWGLSNTTLEEVFMRVTGKKEAFKKAERDQN